MKRQAARDDASRGRPVFIAIDPRGLSLSPIQRRVECGIRRRVLGQRRQLQRAAQPIWTGVRLANEALGRPGITAAAPPLGVVRPQHLPSRMDHRG
jgi:hypothetical protein